MINATSPFLPSSAMTSMMCANSTPRGDGSVDSEFTAQMNCPEPPACQKFLRLPLTTMKAIRVQQFGEPHVLQVAEVPNLTPGNGQIVVRIHAAGVNPVETYIRSGKY